ncbi:MAG TPA: VirB8/TrbF family protein [Thermoanaerobaculia bacterium]|nr:VirB8/TrbF family protein [Thermoanaerobaculia bacterium]
MLKVRPHHLAGRSVHDNRWERLAASRENYRILAALLLALDVFLSVLTWHLATHTQIATYVVQVDRFGQALSAGPIDPKAIPTDALWRWTLSLLIRNLRTVNQDPDLLKMHLDDGLAFLRGHAAALVQDYFREQNPFLLAKSTTVLVQQPITVLRRSKNVWQIEWTETRRDLGGRTVEERWQALATTMIDPPKKMAGQGDDQLKRGALNPLGLYVSDLDWTPVQRRPQ